LQFTYRNHDQGSNYLKQLVFAIINNIKTTKATTMDLTSAMLYNKSKEENIMLHYISATQDNYQT